MKRLVTTVIMLGFLAVSANYGIGIGVAGGLSTVNSGVPGPNGLITLKLSEDRAVPILYFGFSINNNLLTLVGIIDWWFIKEKIVEPLDFYVGAGVYGAFIASTYFSAGIRLPVGLDIKPLEWLEFFLEAGPTLGLYTDRGGLNGGLGLQGMVGVRFWIK